MHPHHHIHPPPLWLVVGIALAAMLALLVAGATHGATLTAMEV